MRAFSITLAIAVLWAIAPAPALSQELPKPGRHEPVTWYSVLRIRFKPGKSEEALKIAYEHFVPGDLAIRRRIINFDFQTGEWDHIVFFPLRQGPAELEWAMSPREAAWWAAFANLEGSPEKAKTVFDQMESLVEEYRWDIARHRLWDVEATGTDPLADERVK